MLSLSSCAKINTEAEIEQIQADFSSASAIYFSADIRADYGNRVYDYGVTFEGLPDSGTVSITAPESIAGTSFRLSDDGGTLIFDGAEVYTGEILPDGLSPADAVPLLINQWQSGLVTECVIEKFHDEDAVAALFSVSDDVTMRTWFGKESSLPLYAEIYFDGYTVISSTFYNVRAE